MGTVMPERLLDTEADFMLSEEGAASLNEEILFEIRVTNGLLGHCCSLLLFIFILMAAKTLYRLICRDERPDRHGQERHLKRHFRHVRDRVRRDPFGHSGYDRRHCAHCGRQLCPAQDPRRHFQGFLAFGGRPGKMGAAILPPILLPRNRKAVVL